MIMAASSKFHPSADHRFQNAAGVRHDKGLGDGRRSIRKRLTRRGTGRERTRSRRTGNGEPPTPREGRDRRR